MGAGPPLLGSADLQRDAGTSGRFPKDGDVVRVPPESCNVPLHPCDGHVLVPQAVVTWGQVTARPSLGTRGQGWGWDGEVLHVWSPELSPRMVHGGSSEGWSGGVLEGLWGLEWGMGSGRATRLSSPFLPQTLLTICPAASVSPETQFQCFVFCLFHSAHCPCSLDPLWVSVCRAACLAGSSLSLQLPRGCCLSQPVSSSLALRIGLWAFLGAVRSCLGMRGTEGCPRSVPPPLCSRRLADLADWGPRC